MTTAAPDLDALLADLAAHMAFPSSDDFTAAAVSRIAALGSAGREAASADSGHAVGVRRNLGRRLIAKGENRPRAQVGAHRPARRLSVPALVAAVLVVAGVLLAVPTSRAAVAGWLGLGGVRVEVVPVSPDAPAVDPEALGTRVALEEATQLAGFPLLLPSGLGEPQDVRLARPSGIPAVTLLYRDGTLLVTGFPVPAGTQIAHKEAGPFTTVQDVTVRGNPGLWLGGEPHAFTWSNGGADQFETLRRAAPTLLWTEDGILWRIEGVADLEGALRLAEGLRPRQ